MKYILLILLGLALTGCFKTTGVTCPQLVNYTEEDRLKVAQELSQPGLEVTQKMIADYLKTRDAIRVCQSWQESP